MERKYYLWPSPRLQVKQNLYPPNSGLCFLISEENSILRNMKLTLFQKKVYNFVKAIPKGKTATYKEVALGIGYPKAYRAVGNALNKNPFAPVVPCHRVIKSDGKPGGFAWGTRKKLQLLRGELQSIASRGR